jgi:cystathionine gamma-synthase
MTLSTKAFRYICNTMYHPSWSRTLSTLTPEEAGRMACDMARIRMQSSESSPRQHHLDTLMAHAGLIDSANAPMSPPLHTATTYTRPASGIYAPSDAIYSRMDGPTRRLLEQTMAHLECHLDNDCTTNPLVTNTTTAHPPTSFAFASGLMAASSILLSHTAPLTVLLPMDCYHGVSSALTHVFARFQVSVIRVDYRNAQWHEALEQIPSHHDILVWLETPSNPLCHVLDVAHVCSLVATSSRRERITTVVDSTLAPPPIQQPLLWGADGVLHSATKYLGGHSDALLGIVTPSPWTEQGRLLTSRLSQVQTLVGGVASPWDCWLTLRGIRTLAVRVQHQSRTALHLAEYLHNKTQTSNTLIHKVHYPGLPSHPQYAIAQRQMQHGLYGGVLSIEFVDASHAMAFAGALTTIQRATSLGGTETLIEHRASIEPPDRVSSPPGLLRISVGLEDVHDLIADVDAALDITAQLFGSGA